MRLNLLYGHLLERGSAKGRGGLAPRTVRNLHVMLHRALSDAVRWGSLPRNPAEDASPPRVSRKRPTIWTPEELGLFVDHVREDRFYALWLLVVTTGFRRGELAGLLRSDVDLAYCTVTPSRPRVVVNGRAQESETKTAAGERTLALDPITRDALRDYIEDWDRSDCCWGSRRSCCSFGPTATPSIPTPSPLSSTSTAKRLGSRGSGCTMSVTPTRRPP